MDNLLFKTRDFLPLRTKDGRFCTKEQQRQERVDDENKRLRYERDKYYRAWLAAAKKTTELGRELQLLKDKIKQLCNG